MTFVGVAHPLHADGLTAAASHAGVDPAILWSVVTVETSGCGFLPDRRPCILFERHIFRTRTGQRFDTAHPGISGSPGGYGPAGAHQYERLEEAIACDRATASRPRWRLFRRFCARDSQARAINTLGSFFGISMDGGTDGQQCPLVAEALVRERPASELSRPRTRSAATAPLR